MRFSPLHIILIFIIMSPAKVSPEEEPKHRRGPQSQQFTSKHFDIPVATQAKIYASLGTNLISDDQSYLKDISKYISSNSIKIPKCLRNTQIDDFVNLGPPYNGNYLNG